MKNPNENGFRPDSPIPSDANPQEKAAAMNKTIIRLEKELSSNRASMYRDQLEHKVITGEEYQKLIAGIDEVVKIKQSGYIYEAPASQRITLPEEVPSYA